MSHSTVERDCAKGRSPLLLLRWAPQALGRNSSRLRVRNGGTRSATEHAMRVWLLSAHRSRKDRVGDERMFEGAVQSLPLQAEGKKARAGLRTMADPN